MAIASHFRILMRRWGTYSSVKVSQSWLHKLDGLQHSLISSSSSCSTKSEVQIKTEVNEENEDKDISPEEIKSTNSTKSSKLKKTTPERPFTSSEKIVRAYVSQLLESSSILGLPSINPMVAFRHLFKPMKTTPTSVYLVDTEVASKFAEIIKAQKPNLSSPVVELNPGLGFLTSELLTKVKFKNITCLEDRTDLTRELKSRFDVTLVKTAFDMLPRNHHLDKHDGGDRINSMLTQIKVSEETEAEDKSKQLYVIGCLPNVSCMNFLIRSYATGRIFYESDLPWNKVTLFIALGSKAHLVATATCKTGFVAYRTTSVLFQTLFKVKHIGDLPRKSFIPWETEDPPRKVGSSKRTARKLVAENPNLCKVMSIEINEDTLAKVGKENLILYWYFVRQNLQARSNRIIPELERWVPGCGIRLIKQGFNIYSIFGDLQPEQMLNMYLEFVSWPEFANSSFSSAVEKFQTRIDITADDDIRHL